MPTVDLTRIGSNIGAMYSLQSLLDINNKLAAAQSRLSTGKRINSAADDPAGLVIATKMNARSEGLKVVQDNISDALNMMSVAESGLSQLTDIVTKMRSKATQAANDTLGSTERAAIQTQLEQFAQQIDETLDGTKWNGVQLLGGTLSKTFQTGVDSGETTVWNMITALTAGDAGLNLAESYTTNGITNNVASSAATFTATPTTSGVSTSSTELTTGGYQFKILDSGSTTTIGKANLSGNLLNGTNTLSTVNASASSGSLVSGHYTLTINAVSGSASVDYTLHNVDDSTVSDIVVTGANLSSSGTNGSIYTSSGSTVITGVKLGFLSDPSALVANTTMSFEYIAQNQAKIELLDASGMAVSIDRDGSGSGTTFADYAYATGATSYNSGRGVQTGALGAIGTLVTNATLSFDYHRQGSYVVDVSSAAKAASYMTKANNALDTINNELANLGSLMARMQIKQTTASTAQINVEAAYNRIMNANMAEEQVNASKYQVLQQTAVAMLAQSNQAPQAILSLFK